MSFEPNEGEGYDPHEEQVLFFYCYNDTLIENNIRRMMMKKEFTFWIQRTM